MGMFDDLIPTQDAPKAKAGMFDDLLPAEPKEVSAVRKQFRDQGPVKIASGNLMGLTDEINSAGAAGIDRLLGRTDDWNERRKAYRAAFKQERAAAEKELGGVGTFAADFAGGMAAAPFKFASPTAPAVSALPLPTMGKLTPMVEAKTATQAVVNPIANTIQNLPTLLKTGAVYGTAGGFIGSPEDDLSSRTRNAAYSGAAGAAFMPALHLGISGAASVAPGIAGTARNAFERMTGTTPQQRQVAAERMDELIAAGVRPEEIYGPMLRPEGGTWLSRSIANSPGGYQRSANAAERHIAALERQLGNEIEQTGAPRHPFTAASERQAFLDRQVNQYSRTPESIQFAADDELARMAEPLTGHLRRPPQPEPAPQPPPRPAREIVPTAPEPTAESAPTFLNPPIPQKPSVLDIIEPSGPRAETAPAFLKRKQVPVAPETMPVQQKPPLEGQALPPEQPARPRLAEPPPRDEGIPYDPTLTDKDRIAAMYEQQNRLIPGQARGGMGTARLPHTRDKNIGALVEDIRRNARAEGRLSGDDASKSFLDSPAADQIEREVRRHLPSDLVTSLFNREGVGPAPRQMMRYRTAVRDADSSNPMMRTTTQTWLPRAEAALTQDIEARLASLKDGGEALAHWQNSNRQYAAWKEQNVAPLKTIVGENVKPEQALDRLTAAMKGKDLTMIRAYAEAHRRGDSAKVGAGALVSHMMEGGLSNFVQQYSAFSPAAKAALFSGKAAELGKSLDRFAKLAEPAVQARERMNWKGLNMHSGIVGTSIIVHNITATMTAVLGQYGIARFMSSPAYVNWITRSAHAVQRGGQSAWRNQLMLLGQVANSEDPEFGKQVVKSISDVLTPQKARAMEMAQ